jgi:SAM-dependent methyltransferase
MDDFVGVNRANWDERVASHLEAYEANAFADDATAVSGIVNDDAEVIRQYLPGGSMSGLKLVHLQCHIGLDTLSWARLGADVTGIDFSAESIRAARNLADRAGIVARFETSTVDDAPGTVRDTFDIVYTSVGVLAWLPRLDTWATSIHALLKPGGVFYVRDSHPILNAIDYDRGDGLFVLKQPYFETDLPTRYDHGTTYAADDIRLENTTTYEWSHSLSEIIQSLLTAGLSITAFAEGKTIPWKALPSLVETPAGYVLPDNPDAIPLEFSLVARRKH